MNAGLIILRVASLGRDAQNESDGAALRSSVAAALQSKTYKHSTSRLRRVPPRGAATASSWLHLEVGRELLLLRTISSVAAASAPSQARSS